MDAYGGGYELRGFCRFLNAFRDREQWFRVLVLSINGISGIATADKGRNRTEFIKFSTRLRV